MKTIARIFLIIEAVSEIMAAVTFFFCGVLCFVSTGFVDQIVTSSGNASQMSDEALQALAITCGITFIMCTIVLVIGAMFGFKTLKKIRTATCKRDIIPWAILNIIFCSKVAGILLLCTPSIFFRK